MKKFAQRLDEPELHALGQAAHVMVGFDQGSRIALDGHTLDHVGIKRPLPQKLRATDRAERFLENLNKGAADDLPLLLGFGHTFQAFDKKFRGIDHPEIDFEISFVERFDVSALIFAQKAVVDKNAGKLLADRLVQESGRNGGIDPAGETEEDAGFANLGPDVGHRVGDKILGGPVLLRTANPDQEIADHVHAAFGVENLRMKLNAVEAAFRILYAGEGRGCQETAVAA